MPHTWLEGVFLKMKEMIMGKYNEIKSLFETHQDEDNAMKMAKYMRNQFIFYGLPTPKRRQLYRDFLKNEKKKKVIDWDFLDICYEDEHREFQYFVIDYLSAMQMCLSYDDVEHIKKYIKMKQWWDTIDAFDMVIGQIGLKDIRIEQLMMEWSVDNDFWLRRIAIDHQLHRKEKTNTELLEKIIVNNFGNDEFFINKAIGWSLREYSKCNPKWVTAFINKYRSQMHPLSIKEASRHID